MEGAPKCEARCFTESVWAVKSKEEEKEHFFCGRHLTLGIRQTRVQREEIVTVRELFV
jgi:hypothetical protein